MINKEYGIYKDKNYIQKIFSFFIFIIVITSVFLLWIDYQVILFVVELLKSSSNIFVSIFGIIFVGIGAGTTNLIIILRYKNYLWRTIVKIESKDTELKIYCYFKNYIIEKRKIHLIKPILFNQMLLLKLESGEKFYLLRYRLDGSRQELINYEYLKFIFPSYLR